MSMSRNGEFIFIFSPRTVWRSPFHVEYGATPLDKQDFSCVVTPESFGRELSDSRTFCIFRELEQLIAAGLVKGGSLDNAVVMHDGAIISKEGMRHREEFARHKMMDMVGDLYLTGMRVHAKISSVKSGASDPCEAGAGDAGPLCRQTEMIFDSRKDQYNV